jgi:glutamyl-tRNA(Gln) amidotransferase subunit E
MLDPDSVDFKQLGFHAGIEVHHQIRSDRKLFCRCPPDLEKDPNNMDYSFYRFFRPVLGEMGDFDPGMLVEFEKGYKVIYYACEHNTCTYEMDETPPFPPDYDVIRKGFILAHYFNCSALAEEIVVNRKQYLDGSITTGFQRTFITGRDGWVPVFGKKVRITNVHIEEDAARRVNWCETADRTVYFNLDRLGIPLTEVITDHRDVDTPNELVELAKQIGRVLRVSRIGRRGIGTARQDINLSIRGGNRAEIKGVQNLAMFTLLCRHEAVRQHSLIELSQQMHERGLKKEDFEHTYVDVTHIFHLKNGNKAFAAIFPKMKRLFGLEVQPNKDFGEEIFEKSMLITGIPREDQFHSDEFEPNAIRKRSIHPCRLLIDDKKYGQIGSILNSGPDDAFILVAGPERRAMHAMKKIVERVKQALDGVPQETRRLLPNGNSEFLRVIHGKERIYPDTDTPPIVISKDLASETRKTVYKRPWEIAQDLHSRYGFNQHQVDLLIRDEKTEKFYNYTEKLSLNGQLAYRILIELPRQKRREGKHLTSRATDTLAEALSRKIILPEQIEKVADILAKDPSFTVKQIVKTLHFKPVTKPELDSLIQRQLSSQDLAKLYADETYRKIIIPKIIGVVLKKLNYSVEGKAVAEKIQTLIRNGRKKR